MMGQKLLGIQSGWWTWSSSVGRKILREIEVWSTHAVFGKTTLKTGIAPQQQMLTTESGRSLQIQKRGRPITTAESAIATRRVGLFRRAGVRLNRRIRGNVENAINSIRRAEITVEPASWSTTNWRAEIMVGQVGTTKDAVLQNRTGLGQCKLEHCEGTRCRKIARA
jgi:hypothetical protein